MNQFRIVGLTLVEVCLFKADKGSNIRSKGRSQAKVMEIVVVA